MSEIVLLSQETIDKIAAGEVIERPSSVVKELVENSMDAKASAITIEIKDGGTSLIRITDNGCGMEKDQVSMAFLRHSTSKIKSVEDLLNVSSLGFRGEALSSIAAVSQVEVITKTSSALTGIRYVIEGSKEKEKEEIGAPDGTTFLVRNLFYNTPARRKFLKTAQTEAGHITALAERLALSRPDISFKLIVNNQIRLNTSGNSNAKDVIYQIYGREITASLIAVEEENELFQVRGFIGKPIVSRGNRNFETYFINQRYVKSTLISKSLEEAYKNFLMQRQYPFCVLYFTFDGTMLDVNVHPAKMELRFSRNEEIYETLFHCVRTCLARCEHIHSVSVETKKPDQSQKKTDAQPAKRELPEPFEKKRIEQIAKAVRKDSPYEPKYSNRIQKEEEPREMTPNPPLPSAEQKETQPEYVQEEICYNGKFLSEQAKIRHNIIGQLFETYWLVEYEEKLFIIDQHAAHEKVLYEKTIKSLKEKSYTTQMMSPPLILTLDSQEADALAYLKSELSRLGFEIEAFGGREYAVCGVPGNLFGLNARQVLTEVLDSYEEIKKASTPDLILEKIASMSCKAAVKGRHAMSLSEADALISELLELENPYFCPHGRPTIISMDKYELEKKFKRIV